MVSPSGALPDKRDQAETWREQLRPVHEEFSYFSGAESNVLHTLFFTVVVLSLLLCGSGNAS
jgi:hypothetical protein